MAALRCCGQPCRGGSSAWSRGGKDARVAGGPAERGSKAQITQVLWKGLGFYSMRGGNLLKRLDHGGL